MPTHEERPEFLRDFGNLTREQKMTFNYGDEVRAGDPHIVWRRIGSHAIFRLP